MSTVNIFIENTLKAEKYYPCPIDWSVEEVVEQIQREHELTGGAIRCGNRPLKFKDIIGDRKEGDILRFANGTKIFIVIIFVRFNNFLGTPCAQLSPLGK